MQPGAPDGSVGAAIGAQSAEVHMPAKKTSSSGRKSASGAKSGSKKSSTKR